MINKLKRKKIIIVLLLLFLILGGGFVYNTWFRRPSFSDFSRFKTPDAVFADISNVISPDKDTIEVDGERVPGGKGLWRYHVSTRRWERVASRVVVTDAKIGGQK